jgi:ribosomal protein L21
MSWRRAAALAVKLIPVAADAVACRQGFPALAAVLRHAQPGCQPWGELNQSFSSSAVQQQAEAAVAESTPAAGAAEALPPEQPTTYTVVGRVSGRYTVPPKRVFAVVEVGGTQFKVTPDDVIITERLRGVDVNDKLQLPRVLLLGSEEHTIIGRPYIPEAHVTAAVEVRKGRLARSLCPLSHPVVNLTRGPAGCVLSWEHGALKWAATLSREQWHCMGCHLEPGAVAFQWAATCSTSHAASWRPLSTPT